MSRGRKFTIIMGYNMKQEDDMELVKQLGISRELTEFSWTEYRVLNDFSNYRWAIQLHPPIERNDLMYFKIYNRGIAGQLPMFTSTKCARISILSPEYIHCSDCSKEEWILNADEKNHLCEILTDKIWKNLLYHYSHELYAYDGRKEIVYNLPMPDYSKLPSI